MKLNFSLVVAVAAGASLQTGPCQIFEVASAVWAATTGTLEELPCPLCSLLEAWAAILVVPAMLSWGIVAPL
jgi:hypothetical protein